MRKFPHIRLLRNVLEYVKHVNTDPEVPEQYRIKDPVTFQGTLKLHGSNTGVRWTRDDGKLQAQSKEIPLTPRGGDFKGFAAFIEEHEGDIRRLLHEILDRIANPDVVEVNLCGEWVGKGVVRKNKGSAVGQLEKKLWVLYSVIFTDFQGNETDVSDILETLPSWEFSGANRIFSIYVAGKWELTIDFNDPDSVTAGQTKAQQVTDSIEAECPFGKYLGVEGRGEGIVWMPQGSFKGQEDLMWKLKTPEHSQILEPKMRKEKVVDEGLELRVGDFLDQVLTEARLERGIDALGEAGHLVEMKSTRHYLQWAAADVQRECALELEDAELEWEQVIKMLNARALDFFKKEVAGSPRG